VRRHAKASFAGSILGSGICRGRLGLICLCVLGLAAFLGISAPSAGAQACPNEGFRQGPSANLPDCRAYEMVSPAEKEGIEVTSLGSYLAPEPTASPSGNSVVFGVARGAFGEPPSAGITGDYLSRRGANWSSENIMPPLGPHAFFISAFIFGFSEDLSKAFTNTERPPLTPDASEGSSNLYLRDNATGSYGLVTVGLAPNLGEDEFQPKGISADAGHVVFRTTQEMPGCGAPAAEYTCEWSAATGTVNLVGRAPVTNEVLTGTVNIAGPNFRHPVSADGSRIFFRGGGEGCGVCVRINAATTQVVSPPGSNFEIASSDGSLAYVTDGGGLYRYDVNADVLTPIVEPVDEVQGVLGASSDGSRVYLVAKGELAPGATAGENNLYLWTAGGGFQFIATGTTSIAFTNNWLPSNPHSRVTADGMHLAFQANNSLTGFPDSEKSEAYLYSVATGELVCASCRVAEPDSGSFIEGGSDWQLARQSRNLSDDASRLFFVTEEALVPQDSNNLQDVYEYDAASGEVALISPGTAGEDTIFGDASANGSDAFFITRERLVPVDQDGALDAYDARVGGGLASQNPPAPTPPCTGDECRGESSSPDLAAPASAGFVGKGNVSQRQNCNKLGREAKKLSNRAKRLRKNAKTGKRNGKSGVAKQRNKKATRLAKRARNKSKSAKRCRKANRRASK
jgi:hypothetical protein